MGTNPRKRTSFCTPLRTTVRRSRGWLEKIVSNDDQLQVRKLLLFLQFALQRRKSLDDAHHILVRTDRARVQNEGIVHQIAFGNQFAIRFGGMAVQKALVNRVVDDLDLAVGNAEELFDFILGELETANTRGALRNTRLVR